VLKFEEEAFRALEKGARIVADCVRQTLGPSGSNVALERRFGSPTITNDGVTIAREIDLKDPFENMGAQLLKEIASKTNEVAGDGTTTAAMLGYEIFKQGMKNVIAGANRMEVMHGIIKAAKFAVGQLKKIARPVSNPDEIRDIATIAANNDEDIGELIRKAMDKVGKDGIIAVEESRGYETELETVDGLQYDKGFLSPYFINNRNRQECVLDNPLIFMTDRRIISIQQEILPIFKAIMEFKRPLLLIADDLEGDPLATMVLNHLKGVVRCVAVRAPGFAMQRIDMLEDIGILTGTTVFSQDKGVSIDQVTAEDFGSAKRVVVSKNSTIIIGGEGDKDKIKERIDELKIKKEKIQDKYEKIRYEERIARLTGGIALIKAGGATEAEMKERRYRIEDAIFATKAAVEEGILPGGGTALLYIQDDVRLYVQNFSKDEKIGGEIVANVLDIPLKQIAENTGVSGEKIISEIISVDESLRLRVGFNAQTNGVEDLYAAGVIDPLKVVRYALEHAASIAAMLISTKVLIAEEVPMPTEIPGRRVKQ